MEERRARDKLVALSARGEASEVVFLAAFAAEGQRIHHPLHRSILLFGRVELPLGREGAAIAGFERNAEESESGWAVVIKGTGEKLPVSRRQHHVVKQFR